MSIIKEFREFALRGSVVDLAVGVIIGTSFGKMITSLVNDVVMPPIIKLGSGVNFSGLFIDLSGKGFTNLKEAQDAGAVTLNYGLFLNTILDFIVVSFCVFIIVKEMNRFRRTAPALPAGPTEAELLTEIRDLLKKKSH